MADTPTTPAYIPDIQTPRAQMIVAKCLRDFREAQTWRNVTAGQWEEIASILVPNYVNTFFYGSYNWPGQKKTQRQVDSNGQLALNRFTAILDSLLTPRNMFWHGLDPEWDYLKKDRTAKQWYDQVTKILFKQRYAATANFASQNQQVWQCLGAFGTGANFVDSLYTHDGRRGLRYRAIPPGELFIRENHQGMIDSFFRWYRLTPRQAYKAFGDRIPARVKAALDQGSETPQNYLQYVAPRDEDYDPHALDHRRLLWFSYTICVEAEILVKESGFNTFPLPVSRYEQAPGEVYGRSPAMQVLPSLKTLNAQKATFLKQGHRASDPTLLTVDDDLLDINRTPGGTIAGGMSPDGKMLVGILPTGNIQINEKMMAEEKSLIADVFLVTLFQIMTESPQMTATEVIERTNEKGILLAPTVGRQQSEYLGPLIDRELDLLMQLRLIPPPPPIVREARMAYSPVYTSPISRAMRAQEAAGFMRTIETVKELVNITGDPSLLDTFNFDNAVPAIADIQAVPTDWMATKKEMQIKRQNRAKAQQQKAQQDSLPGQAAMLNAQAKIAKAQPGVAPGEQGFGGPQGPPQQ